MSPFRTRTTDVSKTGNRTNNKADWWMKFILSKIQLSLEWIRSFNYLTNSNFQPVKLVYSQLLCDWNLENLHYIFPYPTKISLRKNQFIKFHFRWRLFNVLGFGYVHIMRQIIANIPFVIFQCLFCWCVNEITIKIARLGALRLYGEIFTFINL